MAEELDSALDPILGASRLDGDESAPTKAINLPDGRTLKHNRNFMLYISTKLVCMSP